MKNFTLEATGCTAANRQWHIRDLSTSSTNSRLAAGQQMVRVMKDAERLLQAVLSASLCHFWNRSSAICDNVLSSSLRRFTFGRGSLALSEDDPSTPSLTDRCSAMLYEARKGCSVEIGSMSKKISQGTVQRPEEELQILKDVNVSEHRGYVVD